MNSTNQGHCLCGAVRFEVSGDPIYNVVCHCENCKYGQLKSARFWFDADRRTSGGTFATASIYLRKQYRLVKPAASDPAAPDLENISIYADYATQSGKPLYRRFCTVCGSKLSAITPLSDEIISVPAGVLNQAGMEWKPQKEQFCVDKAGWLPALGDLIQTQHGPGSKEVDALK